MLVLVWLMLLPLRLCRGAVVFLWVLAVGILSQGGRDDGDADAGRWKLQRGNHPGVHLVPPAIGRKGWMKR
jgi:hypothetical protein